MIAFALTPEPDASDYERRCREQIAELRADNGLCATCGERPHLGRCRFALGYYDRKATSLCTYNGCPDACSETSVLCESHRQAQVERQRDSRTGRHGSVRG